MIGDGLSIDGVRIGLIVCVIWQAVILLYNVAWFIILNTKDGVSSSSIFFYGGVGTSLIAIASLLPVLCRMVKKVSIVAIIQILVTVLYTTLTIIAMWKYTRYSDNQISFGFMDLLSKGNIVPQKDDENKLVISTGGDKTLDPALFTMGIAICFAFTGIISIMQTLLCHLYGKHLAKMTILPQGKSYNATLKGAAVESEPV